MKTIMQMVKPIGNFIALLVTITLLTGLISACTPAVTETPAPAQTQPLEATATTASENFDRPLVYSIDYDFVSLNPLKRMYKGEQILAHLLTDTLGTVSSDGSIEYLLAESYSLSPDGLTYTFKIRDNVYFHDGVKLTADDVVFSFNQDRTYEQNESVFLNVDTIEKVDDLTVQVNMTSPYGYALTNLMNEVSIVPKAYFEEVGEAGYEEHPIGTGPYTFGNRVEGVSVTVNRYDKYWRGPASFPSVKLKVIPDATTAALALENNEIDALLINASDAETLAKNPDFTVAAMPSNYLTYIILNQKVAPFDNLQVRQAVAYALDRQSMLDVLIGGYGEVNTVLCPRSVFGCSGDIKPIYEYNIDKAKQLIAQSGLQTPVDIGDIVCWGTTEPIAEMVQYSLSQIGFNAKIQTYDFATALSTMKAGDFAVGTFRAGWGNDASLLSDIYKTGGVVNYAQLSVPRIDELSDLALSETDPNKRIEYYTELFSLVNENAVYLMLYDSAILVAYNKDLVVPVALNAQFKLYDWHWKN